MGAATRWIVVAGAVAAFVFEALGALPAPTIPLLAFAVAVPEVASRALAFGVASLLAVAVVVRGRARVVGLASAAIACALALVPLAQYPQTRLAADAALRTLARDAPVASRAPIDPATIAVRTVPVRTRDGATLAMDVYRAAVRGARPTVVTIYGGAWMFGTRADTASIDRALAARGYTTIAIDYRHAPTYRYPTALHDVQDALAQIARDARRLDVDPERVAIFGRSAGAELALLAAYAPLAVRVRGVVAYYAPTDLVDGYRVLPFPDPANVRAILRAYLGTPPEANLAAYRSASPVAHVRAGLPPTLLAIGLRDALVRPQQQRELRDALRAHGDAVVAIELPWSNHAFDAVPGGLGETLVRGVTDRFLAATLGS
ncbi:MAG: hypothetical protein NVSMB59_07300 [Vulcanimicrobiaceae bacterium]